jgi:hypothetical protein
VGSLRRGEGTAFGSGAEAPIEVDGAANDRNARGRQLSRILVDKDGLLIHSKRDFSGFEYLTLVRRRLRHRRPADFQISRLRRAREQERCKSVTATSLCMADSPESAS